MVFIPADVGEACLGDEYCLYENSKCDDFICRCITGIYDKTSKICDRSEFRSKYNILCRYCLKKGAA